LAEQEVIRILKEGGCRTKSGIMLGLGERKEEVIQTMKNLRDNGATLSQLGSISSRHKNIFAVNRFVHSG
jgi:lipoic acid synthetase